MANPLKAKKTPAAEVRRGIIEYSRQDMPQTEIARRVSKSQQYVSKVLKAYREELNRLNLKDVGEMMDEAEDKIRRVLQSHSTNLSDPESARVYLKAVEMLCKLRGLNEETSNVNVALPVQINYNVDE